METTPNESNWGTCIKCGRAVWIPDGKCLVCRLPVSSEPEAMEYAAQVTPIDREPWYVGASIWLVLGLLPTIATAFADSTTSAGALVGLFLGTLALSFTFLVGYYVRGIKPRMAGIGLGGIALAATFALLRKAANTPDADWFDDLGEFLLFFVCLVLASSFVVGSVAEIIVNWFVKRR